MEAVSANKKAANKIFIRNPECQSSFQFLNLFRVGNTFFVLSMHHIVYMHEIYTLPAPVVMIPEELHLYLLLLLLHQSHWRMIITS